MTMDVHNRFRTEAHKDVVARFNERFLLSLAQCSAALVVDDELNVLPISTAAKNFLATHQPSEEERVDPVRMLIVGLFFAMH
jgi:N-acetyltransferase 10